MSSPAPKPSGDDRDKDDDVNKDIIFTGPSSRNDNDIVHRNPNVAQDKDSVEGDASEPRQEQNRSDRTEQ